VKNTPSGRPTPTSTRKDSARQTVGKPADKPCEHALTLHDTIPDPTRPGRTMGRTTHAPCVRTRGHDRAEGDTTRKHRTHSGQEW
jgi:hypothetical protein